MRRAAESQPLEHQQRSADHGQHEGDGAAAACPTAADAGPSSSSAVLPPQLKSLASFRDDVLRGLHDISSCFLPRDLRKKLKPLEETCLTVSTDLDRALALHSELLARNRALEDSIASFQAGMEPGGQGEAGTGVTAAAVPSEALGTGAVTAAGTRAAVGAGPLPVGGAASTSSKLGDELNLDSLLSVPSPQDWDQHRTSLVQGLKASDAALIHRQFLEKAALLLPSIVAFGSSSPNHNTLAHLLQQYRKLVRGIREVNPLAEEERTGYDMESLAATSEGVDTDRLSSRFQAALRHLGPQQVRDTLSAWQDLCQHTSSLQQQRQRLVAMLNGACASDGSWVAEYAGQGAQLPAGPSTGEPGAAVERAGADAPGCASGPGVRGAPGHVEMRLQGQHLQQERTGSDVRLVGGSLQPPRPPVGSVAVQLGGRSMATLEEVTLDEPEEEEPMQLLSTHQLQQPARAGMGEAAALKLEPRDAHTGWQTVGPGPGTDQDLGVLVPGPRVMLMAPSQQGPEPADVFPGLRLNMEACLDSIDHVASQLEELLKKQQELRDWFCGEINRIMPPQLIISFALEFYPMPLDLLDVFTRCAHVLEAEAAAGDQRLQAAATAAAAEDPRLQVPTPAPVPGHLDSCGDATAADDQAT